MYSGCVLRVYPPPYFWILHIDGSAKPNPGRMTAGAALWAPHGAQWQSSQTLPGTGCNNEAELRALQMGLHMALERNAHALRIYTDSRWLMEQLAPPLPSGRHLAAANLPRTTPRLRPMLETTGAQLHALHEVQWRWVPRHCNTEADALARNAQGMVAIP